MLNPFSETVFRVYDWVSRNCTTVFPLIEARSLIQAGGSDFIFVIEAGSVIHAGSLIEAGGLRANTIELIAHHPVALWCTASFVRIA